MTTNFPNGHQVSVKVHKLMSVREAIKHFMKDKTLFDETPIKQQCENVVRICKLIKNEPRFELTSLLKIIGLCKRLLSKEEKIILSKIAELIAEDDEATSWGDIAEEKEEQSKIWEDVIKTLISREIIPTETKTSSDEPSQQQLTLAQIVAMKGSQGIRPFTPSALPTGPKADIIQMAKKGKDNDMEKQDEETKITVYKPYEVDTNMSIDEICEDIATKYNLGEKGKECIKERIKNGELYRAVICVNHDPENNKVCKYNKGCRFAHLRKGDTEDNNESIIYEKLNDKFVRESLGYPLVPKRR